MRLVCKIKYNACQQVWLCYHYRRSNQYCFQQQHMCVPVPAIKYAKTSFVAFYEEINLFVTTLLIIFQSTHNYYVITLVDCWLIINKFQRCLGGHGQILILYGGPPPTAPLLSHGRRWSRVTSDIYWLIISILQINFFGFYKN